MVTAALRTIGVQSPAFSGVSCRMGGLTVATTAGVPESIMWMQSAVATYASPTPTASTTHGGPSDSEALPGHARGAAPYYPLASTAP